MALSKEMLRLWSDCWVRIPASLNLCDLVQVTLSSMPQFPLLKSGDNIYLTGVYED